MRKHLLLLVLTCLLIMGCRKVPFPVVAYSDDWDYLTRPVGEGLVAKSDSPIPDVPIPVGFAVLPSRSESSFDGYARTVRHEYQGRSTIEEVATFYNRHVAMWSWRLLDRSQDLEKSTVLRYVRGRENMNIRVHQSYSITTVVVSITPRDAGAPYAAKNP